MSTPYKLLITTLSALAMAAVSSNNLAATTSIDFDGTGAPCCFASTSPLTNLYSGQGVTFSGGNGSGGSILSQSGGFGFNARSGTDFLAFNTTVGTGSIQVMSFANLATNVSIWANSAFGDQFIMQAFDTNNGLLDTSIVAVAQGWQELAVSGTGIAFVQVSAGNSYWAYDDLSFNDDRQQSVPEPGSLALVGLGLAAFALRKRQSA